MCLNKMWSNILLLTGFVFVHSFKKSLFNDDHRLHLPLPIILCKGMPAKGWEGIITMGTP